MCEASPQPLNRQDWRVSARISYASGTFRVDCRPASVRNKEAAMLTIFDCDGVLVDSEAIACRVCAESLTEVGIVTTTEEILDRYIGGNAHAMIADLETRHGRMVPADFHDTLSDRIEAAFETGPLEIDGIDTVLSSHRGKVCVASGSGPQRVRHCLTLVGLLGYFDPHIFTTTQVARGKPAPDLFLYAAKQMGAEVHECLVIEDSLIGVTAAVAAGMRVIGFTGASHCRPGHADRLLAAGAATTIRHMRELPELL
jgi:HAD superfamily hydrolase (TIGR01509 family)